MNLRQAPPIISLCILTILTLHRATAESDSFLATLLRFTGISVTANQVKGSEGLMEGDIWLAHVGAAASEPLKITSGGAYHTPLWLPGSLSILAMKSDKQLVQLNTDGNGEKTLHTLTDNTELIGFDKNNPNQVLVLQEEPIVGVLSVASGQVTPLPYDKENPEDRFGLDQLRRGFRDYGNTQVSIENQSEVDPQGHFKPSSTIHIKLGNKDISIRCPITCSQPALAEDGQQLLFIGH